MNRGNVDIHAIIDDYRRKIPVDVVGLIEELGIKYIVDKNLPRNISGVFEKQPAREDGYHYKIIVDGNDTLARQRFTAAHELGHYVLHRYLIKTGVDDNRAYRTTDNEKYSNELLPRHETEANRFASALLLPAGLVEEAFKKNGENIKVTAEQFGVSEQAMRIRLNKVEQPA